ncbi:MAG: FAD-dependent oxidoreductase, partial [Pseudoprimorskyibacter sp.]|nr:FAD-dependent oxidoreductase [Pseudoprimorskyibacter sp.]
MKADYVIVGAGSAGCTVAYRLAEAGHSVIVIEFGGTDAGPFIQMPGALSYPMNMSRYDWGYQSDPEPHLGGRRIVCPRGKVIGGSSSINGMIYVRGHALDYDHWRDQGASGWGYADVLPYFKRMEHWSGTESGWRGHDGPLRVTRAAAENPLMRAFIDAGGQAGYPITQDYNGHQQEGFGHFDMTVHRGARYSAAKAYLRPAQKLGVRLVRGLAHRVVIKEGRAVGVDLGDHVIHANHEVILAASSINSPKLLMLSGIGPADHLRSHGISVLADRPGVGQNLQDHLELYIQKEATQPVSLYSYWNPLGKAYVGARWMFTRTG